MSHDLVAFWWRYYYLHIIIITARKFWFLLLWGYVIYCLGCKVFTSRSLSRKCVLVTERGWWNKHKGYSSLVVWWPVRGLSLLHSEVVSCLVRCLKCVLRLPFFLIRSYNKILMLVWGVATTWSLKLDAVVSFEAQNVGTQVKLFKVLGIELFIFVACNGLSYWSYWPFEFEVKVICKVIRTVWYAWEDVCCDAATSVSSLRSISWLKELSP